MPVLCDRLVKTLGGRGIQANKSHPLWGGLEYGG